MDYKIINLSKDEMSLAWQKLKVLSNDMDWDYWDEENFSFELPQKWDLSFYIKLQNDIIGYCIASEKKDYVWLHHIIIGPNYRNKGIGAIILNELEKRVLSLTLKQKIGLKVAKDNKGAFEFYIKNKYTKQTEEEDNLIMVKEVKKNSNMIAIHQPNYIPWAGYFYKILSSDSFVFLDDVQYTKNSFINRNRIKGPQGEQWLTIPVKASIENEIREVKFAKNNWAIKHIKTLEACYGKSRYYKHYKDEFDEILLTPFENLSELNISIIKKICEWLNINVNFYLSSELNIEGKSDERLIEIMKKLNGKNYLSGSGGSKYQDENKFLQEGIQVIYYQYKVPIYEQLWGEFIPGLSILDLIFNEGENSLEILKNTGVMDEVQNVE